MIRRLALPKSPHREPPILRNEERGERITIYLPTDLATALRARCALNRWSLSGAVSLAVDEYMQGWRSAYAKAKKAREGGR
jgi:hypothetical protein